MARSILLVPFDEIPEDGYSVDLDRALPAFAAILDQAATLGTTTGTASVQMQRWPQRVDVTGGLKLELDLICVRCTATFRTALAREIRQILVRKPEGADPEEEFELTRGDLDRSEMVGDTVNLAELLAEEVQLTLPAKPLCSEDCKGICQRCGADLNSEECDCGPEIDPRWEALAGLKLKQD